MKNDVLDRTENKGLKETILLEEVREEADRQALEIARLHTNGAMNDHTTVVRVEHIEKPAEPRRKKVGKLKRLKEVGRSVKKNRRELVEVAKHQDYPFTRLLFGGKKPDKAPLKPDWKSWKNDELTMAWIGHSTVLINFYGTWVLTDPVFSERVGIRPLGFTIGPKRLVQPALEIDELPPIDLIVISHLHMDHCDIPSLKKLWKAKHVLTAKNTIDIYKGISFASIRELDWGEVALFHDLDLQVEALEVQHYGWRYPWEKCRRRDGEIGRSFNGYLIEKRDPQGEMRSIVFAGDTCHIDKFKRLGERMEREGREVDVAMMPIGAYNPWVLAHCNPEQAWEMAEDMRARYIFPLHWRTIIQSSEPLDEPIEWLENVVDDPNRILVDTVGETVEVPID